jgi:hypothetical protein
MAIVLDGTSGITNDSGYTGDGVSFADSTPANTLVTNDAGNVGIGTSSPTNKLHIQNASGGSGGYLKVTDAVYGGDVRFGMADGVDNDAVAGVWSNNNFKFYTNSAERARINSSGNLLINWTGSATYKLFVSADSAGSDYPAAFNNANSGSSNQIVVDILRNNTRTGYITNTNTTTAFTSTSDYRLKEDVQPMTNALAKVAALKPVTYKWKVDGSDGQGFIAHELAEVVPDCVSGEKDGVDAEGNPQYQGIDTSFLVATLTAALQEAHGLIKDLQARVDALEAK